MIKEIAQLTIKPGMEPQFEQGVSQAKPLFLRSRGCHGVQLFRSIEQPEQYTLVVDWETVEDHMVHFRESDEFQQWRALVGGTFAAPPNVHHVSKAL
ncbi:Antibiotic biosynthesis monooxygenase [Cupriavidus oxalaticus]|uniref:antibiotic biosynthesis monooxygenase family protein n=1 Tax=Cupriavidus oxalaticus TaxID=96344 RepID=UPI003F73EEEB